jgi:hypothetical protein
MKGGYITYRLFALLVVALFLFVSSYEMKGVQAQRTKPLTKEEGVAKDGEFERTAKPAFTFDYPKETTMQPLKYDYEIFRGVTPDGITINVQIFEIDLKKDIDEQLKGHANGYVDALKQMGSKKVKLIYVKPTDRYENFKAYEFELEWLWLDGSTVLTTYVNVIQKEGHVISMQGHTVGGIEPIAIIFESIDLEP